MQPLRSIVHGVSLLAMLSTCAQAQTASPGTVAPYDQSVRRDWSVTPCHDSSEAETREATPTSVANFAKNFVIDQKDLWTSPARVRCSTLSWLVPLAGATVGVGMFDRRWSHELTRRPGITSKSSTFSDFGLAASLAAPAGMYVLGKWRHSDKLNETAILSTEAVANAISFGEVVKYLAGRSRPGTPQAGAFRTGGDSFPSVHSLAAWSFASVFAHEFDRPFPKYAAYAFATGVSVARVSAGKHFPTDVMVGSAAGYLIGTDVFHRRHSRDVSPDASFGTFIKDSPEQADHRRLASPYVPTDDWAYSAVERLAALGHVQSLFSGLRPWTRLEFARLVSEAEETAVQDESGATRDLLDALNSEFSREISLYNNADDAGAISVDSVYSRSTYVHGTPLTDSFHFGQSFIRDHGRPTSEGFNNVSGFTASATQGRFALFLRTEYQHAGAAPAYTPAARAIIADRDSLDPATVPLRQYGEVNTARVIEGYVAMKLADTQISFGKQSLYWGPTEMGSFMFSDNAEPIYMLRFTQDSPFKMPGIFGFMGPVRTDFFIGKISGHSFPRQPFIHGQKISFKPTPNLELGFSRTALFAGEGHGLTLGSLKSTLFSTTSVGTDPRHDPGDRRGGFDFSYKLPYLRNHVTIYNDSLVDDDPSPLAAPRRAAMNPGIFIVHLPYLPKLDLRAEASYTDVPTGRSLHGQFIYWNINYHNGYTNKGVLLGNAIGREGIGGQFTARYWFTPHTVLHLGYRANDENGSDFLPGGATLRAVNSRLELLARKSYTLDATIEGQRWNVPVLAPRPMNLVATGLSITYTPRRKDR